MHCSWPETPPITPKTTSVHARAKQLVHAGSTVHTGYTSHAGKCTRALQNQVTVRLACSEQLNAQHEKPLTVLGMTGIPSSSNCKPKEDKRIVLLLEHYDISAKGCLPGARSFTISDGGWPVSCISCMSPDSRA